MTRNDECLILLLEDEPLILLDLEMAAEELGCRTLTARTIEEACTHIEKHRITVAVLDVSLGQNKTCEPVARRLSADDIPFVLHSGDLNRTNETVRQLGAELIPKPALATHVIKRALARVQA